MMARGGGGSTDPKLRGECNLKKLRLRKEVVRKLDQDDLRKIQAGQMNLSLKGCPTHFCTTADPCIFWTVSC